MFAANHYPPRPSSRQSSYGAHRYSVQPVNATKLRPSNMSDDGAASSGSANNAMEGGDTIGEEDSRQILFKEHYERSEARLVALLSGGDPLADAEILGAGPGPGMDVSMTAVPQLTPVLKRPARAIDEDDYGDDDDGEDDETVDTGSPLQSKSTTTSNNLLPGTTNIRVPSLSAKPGIERTNSASSSDQVKTSEEVRKKLEQAKKAAEDTARRHYYTEFYTLENDRGAMLEQQRLDELDRQVEAEVSGQSGAAHAHPAVTSPQHGSLSNSNLGASNLTMKHLIARIDARRSEVHATDAQLRGLISEVRKNRSKWASEDKIGQEELYEAAEKVLMELKANTEHSAPFLQRVNKRDAPDYYTVIKHPMDLGTMMKKLKTFQYKSKKDFVDDLNLIWSNCLKYNADPAHFLRKKALYMRRETEKLVPLIPEIVVRDRAEVEAEERRAQAVDAGIDGAEDSDDEPIMASRGRKAPSKGKNSARKAPPGGLESTPGIDVKPPMPTLINSTSNLKHEFLRADSDAPMEGSVNGFSTPPPGNLTPLRANGIFSSGAPGSQADVSDADGTGNSLSGIEIGPSEDADFDDFEYKTWKQVTKKDRAMIAAERNRLFRGDRLNLEEPALLRSKAGMRRWFRQRKLFFQETPEDTSALADDKEGLGNTAAETFAEGIGGEEERLAPDSYDPLSSVPELEVRLRWAEDSDGQVIDQNAEFLRVVPKGYFTSPESNLTRRMDSNMRQMQETRKVCAKIGIVKQMQLQSQMYQNQFQKYDPQPFVEADIDPLVVSDDGPVMAPWVCWTAFQRSVAKIFYHAGFEEFQPSALDAVTDIAAKFFTNIARSYRIYHEQPMVKKMEGTTTGNEQVSWKPRYTAEEVVLHCLTENGVDLESLETYVKEDVERLGGKLITMHERMKTHLAELLRPALDPNTAGADGAGAFADGSEQFVGGDFAEDIDEDFFGFKELGLDKEFGLASLSVPLHLLQNRMHTAYQAQNANTVSSSGDMLELPDMWPHVTNENIGNEIGLVQSFFRKRLHSSNNEPLLEDEDLPIKQRYPKPRLPPNGKISSPRKRPPREMQQLAKKKRKLEESKEDINSATNGVTSNPVKPLSKPVGKLRLEMPAAKEPIAEPEKEDNSAVGMISPESIVAA